MRGPNRVVLVAFLLSVLGPGPAAGQGLGAASIAGVVKDTSGGVLPGVTVEAASPVLIEKARSTITDDEGRYRIAELRPGTYSLTFTLSGFATFKRDGLELTPNFVATINTELRVGVLSETVVVTGETPLVDARSVAKGAVINQATLTALPTSKSVGSMLAFVPGAVSPTNGVDTGGTKGEQSVRISVFGARPNDMRQMTNGMQYTNLNGDGGGRLYFVNPITIQENVIDLGAAGSAQYQFAGAVVNTIPREGGNRWSGSAFGTYTNHSLQSNNLSDDLRAQGLTVVNGVRSIGDASALIGGPIVKDKWWFVTSGRVSGSTLRAASLFHDANSGLSPSDLLAVCARPRAAGGSGGAEPELSVPHDVSVQDEGQVQRVDRHPASLQGSGVRAARSGDRTHRGERRDVPQRFADAVHVEPPAVEPAALRGRRHRRSQHVRDGELRREA